MTNPLIGLRIKALRDQHELDQKALADIIGVGNHQTVSAIESGERRIKPSEIETMLDYFKLDDDYFTDPFRLVGEGQFSWRQEVKSKFELEAYRKRSGRWLAMYRALSAAEGRPGPKERLSLRLSENSTFEAACVEAERLTMDYKMGEVPARELPRVMEENFGILVLMVDMEQGMSGAACRLPELDAVLVNRTEPLCRRNFDLAHEFFHILTWDTMPPKPVEFVELGGNRIEQLANNFAAALLLPQRLLKRFGDWIHLGNAERASRIRKIADYFQVSTIALHWRLVALKLIPRNAEILDATDNKGEDVEDGLPVSKPGFNDNQHTPPLFSRNFFMVLGTAIDKGLISIGKATKLLEINRETLRDLFAEHGVAAPITI